MFQILASGVALGAIYALAAVGFVLIHNVSGSVNFSHGALVLLGGFLGIAGNQWLGLPMWLSLVLTAVVMAGLGAVMEWCAFRPLQGKPFVAVFISTLAFGMIVSSLILIVAGPQPRTGTPLVDGVVRVGGAAVPWQAVIILVLTGVIVAGQWMLFHRTRWGAMLRATADDAPTAEITGIRTQRVRAIVFGIAVALAGTAGVLIAPIALVDPGRGGIEIMLKLYIAVVIGGFGSELGAVLGGLLLGLAEVLTAGYLTSTYRDVLIFAVLLVFLVVRPQGLLGPSRLREV